jgi:hypothetical protein
MVRIGVVVHVRRAAAGGRWLGRATEARQQRGRIGDICHPVTIQIVWSAARLQHE